MRLLKKILPFLKNKYSITILIFVFWMLFFDNHNLIDRISAYHQINQLEKENEYYKKKIDTDNKKLRELKTDKNNLEKFAREQYWMKKENEDIYIVEEE